MLEAGVRACLVITMRRNADWGCGREMVVVRGVADCLWLRLGRHMNWGEHVSVHVRWLGYWWHVGWLGYDRDGK